MKTTALAVLAGLAIGFGGSVASAHPTTVKQNNKVNLKKATIKTEMPQQDDFSDDFEAYKPGSEIVGQGGWEAWYLPGGVGAEVSTDQARSGENSLKVRPTSDVVQRFTAEEGQWTFSVQTYVPSSSTGDGYVIMMNQYEVPADNWSLQVRFNPLLGVVENQSFGGVNTQVPLVEDAWAEFRAEIDLDADLLDIFYDGAPLVSGLVWSQNVSGGGITSIANVDLYSQTIDVMYFDDVALTGAGGGECYADCDENTILDFFDFLCYLNAFNNEDPYADCDENTVLDFFDFLCYLNEFNDGCE